MTQGATPIIVLVGRYPQVTTTFIDRELTALRHLGIQLEVVALRRPPADMPLSGQQRAIAEDVRYLLPVPIGSFVMAHLRFAAACPRRYFGTLAYLLGRRYPSARARCKSLAHFAEGVALAHLVARDRPREIYAHFADRAVVVAFVASRLLGVPYSVSIHAGADIYVHPVLLSEKIDHARRVVTCTAANQAQIASVVGDELAAKARYVRHGLELAQYHPSTEGHGHPPLVLAVGQLREKKGFAHLVAACARLRDRGLEFRCEIVGEGPERPPLESLIEETGLRGTIELRGALPHDEVVARYRDAQVFVLPCIRTRDGHVDGIPNVVPEAMATGLPVVSSDLPAMRELIDDGVHGLLVAPGDEPALADALARVLREPALRARLGRSAREVVTRHFDVEINARHLVAEMWPDLLELTSRAPA